MPSLQNADIDAMNSIVDHHEEYVPYGTYKYIYAKTSEHSLLHQYVVNNYYIIVSQTLSGGIISGCQMICWWISKTTCSPRTNTQCPPSTKKTFTSEI